MTFRKLFIFCVGFAWLHSLQAQRDATLLDHKDRIRISPVSILNSKYRETNLSITPDGKYLYYMSLRGGQYWSNSFMTYDSDSVFDGDIWYSKRVGGKWQKPQCMPMGINTASGEDEPCISPDAKTVYFQSWKPFWQISGGPYYKATFQGTAWSRPEGLGGGITQFFLNINATDGMSVSPDGKKFMVACGTNYDGNMDIYTSTKVQGVWVTPKKSAISTSGNERSVFIAHDGNTVYFASNGYKGYGGLDIFKATLNPDGSVGEVINIGEPFNTRGDDYGFILTDDGMEAYFIRNGDIYFADLRDADARIRPQAEVGLSGVVRDEKTQIGINNATIIIMDATTQQVIRRVKTGAKGKYAVGLPNKTASYDVAVIADGYPKDIKQLPVSEAESEQAYHVDFALPSIPPILAANTPRPATPSNPNPGIAAATPPTPPKPKPQLPPIAQIAPAPPLRISTPTSRPTPERITPVEDPYSFVGIAKNNLIFLIDVSSSMDRPDRLPLFKKSLRRVIEYMRPEDRISVIVYSGEVQTVIEGMSAANREEILRIIDNLAATGETRARSGVKKAYEVAKNNFIPDGNNRILLATDGDFLVDDVIKVIENKGTEGVALSVFAFGKQSPTRTNEMQRLAQAGNGNFALITFENADEALLNEAKAVRALK